MATKSKAGGRKPDIATFAGLILAVGGILLGQKLEGGSPHQIVGESAALIVMGGTFGAVLVSTPLRTMMRALKRLQDVFFEPNHDPAATVEEIIGYATKARKSGIVSLEMDAQEINDPFMRKALTLAVDGTDLQEIRNMMELEIGIEEQRVEAEAKVFEAAGGYSPTIGIIGAVIGLILVMGDLSDTNKVGAGIASAFVATIYGVGFANIFCLPAATKIKARAHARTETRELVLEGVIGIVEGLNPKLIRTKLGAYIQTTAPRKSPAATPSEVEAPADATPAKS